jgi:gluconokinase
MNRKYVVMGVSGCGKSSIGAALGNALNIPFFDGDDFHPHSNVEKMQNGHPLTDDDRQSWLSTLNELLLDNDDIVLACSALKPAYRDRLRQGGVTLIFIYLKGDFDTIWSRLKRRENHYFNGAEMLLSQFDTLIEPTYEEALYINIAQKPAAIVEEIVSRLSIN